MLTCIMIERNMVSNDVLYVVINCCYLLIFIVRVAPHDALVLLLIEEEAVGFMRMTSICWICPFPVVAPRSQS